MARPANTFALYKDDTLIGHYPLETSITDIRVLFPQAILRVRGTMQSYLAANFTGHDQVDYDIVQLQAQVGNPEGIYLSQVCRIGLISTGFLSQLDYFSYLLQSYLHRNVLHRLHRTSN